MREIRQSGSEGGGAEIIRSSVPPSGNWSLRDRDAATGTTSLTLNYS